MKNRTGQILLIAFVLTLAAYLVMFAACFSQFPISASPLLQFLILYFHAIPMLLIQLLLFRLSKPWRWKLLPFLPMLVVGLAFLRIAEWHILGWILVLWWCAAPAAGCVLAWAAYGLCRLYQKGDIRNAH